MRHGPINIRYKIAFQINLRNAEFTFEILKIYTAVVNVPLTPTIFYRETTHLTKRKEKNTIIPSLPSKSIFIRTFEECSFSNQEIFY